MRLTPERWRRRLAGSRQDGRIRASVRAARLCWALGQPWSLTGCAGTSRSWDLSRSARQPQRRRPWRSGRVRNGWPARKPRRRRIIGAGAAGSSTAMAARSCPAQARRPSRPSPGRAGRSDGAEPSGGSAEIGGATRPAVLRSRRSRREGHGWCRLDRCCPAPFRMARGLEEARRAGCSLPEAGLVRARALPGRGSQRSISVDARRGRVPGLGDAIGSWERGQSTATPSAVGDMSPTEFPWGPDRKKQIE
jgi:hypothetical protein